MLNFKKGYNLKVASIVIAILFLFNSMVYSYPFSKYELRVQLDEDYERANEAMTSLQDIPSITELLYSERYDEALEKLIPLTRSEDNRVSDVALSAVRKIWFIQWSKRGPIGKNIADTVGFLSNFCRHTNEKIRNDVIGLLNGDKPEELVNGLILLLNVEKTDVGYDAFAGVIAALGLIGDKRATEPLLSLLKSHTFGVGTIRGEGFLTLLDLIVFSVAQIKDKRSIEPLIILSTKIYNEMRKIESNNPYLNQEELSEEEGRYKIYRSIFSKIRNALLNFDDEKAYLQYLSSIKAVGSTDKINTEYRGTMQTLLEALADEISVVRVGASCYLVVNPDDKVRPILIQHLKFSRSNQLRAGAAIVLRAFRDKEVVETLCTALFDDERSIARASYNSLVKLKDLSSLPYILAGLVMPEFKYISSKEEEDAVKVLKEMGVIVDLDNPEAWHIDSAKCPVTQENISSQLEMINLKRLNEDPDRNVNAIPSESYRTDTKMQLMQRKITQDLTEYKNGCISGSFGAKRRSISLIGYLGLKEYEGDLIDVVKGAKDQYTVPYLDEVILTLGRLKSRDSLPYLVEIIERRNQHPIVVVKAAIESIERIKDVEAIEEVLRIYSKDLKSAEEVSDVLYHLVPKEDDLAKNLPTIGLRCVGVWNYLFNTAREYDYEETLLNLLKPLNDIFLALNLEEPEEGLIEIVSKVKNETLFIALLGKMKSRKAVNAIKNAYESSDTKTRKAIFDSLVRIATNDGIQFVINHARRGKIEDRKNAINALKFSNLNLARPTLTHIIRNSSVSELQKEAEDVLHYLNSQERNFPGTLFIEAELDADNYVNESLLRSCILEGDFIQIEDRDFLIPVRDPTVPGNPNHSRSVVTRRQCPARVGKGSGTDRPIVRDKIGISFRGEEPPHDFFGGLVLWEYWYLVNNRNLLANELDKRKDSNVSRLANVLGRSIFIEKILPEPIASFKPVALPVSLVVDKDSKEGDTHLEEFKRAKDFVEQNKLDVVGEELPRDVYLLPEKVVLEKAGVDERNISQARIYFYQVALFHRNSDLPSATDVDAERRRPFFEFLGYEVEQKGFTMTVSKDNQNVSYLQASLDIVFNEAGIMLMVLDALHEGLDYTGTNRWGSIFVGHNTGEGSYDHDTMQKGTLVRQMYDLVRAFRRLEELSRQLNLPPQVAQIVIEMMVNILSGRISDPEGLLNTLMDKDNELINKWARKRYDELYPDATRHYRDAFHPKADFVPDLFRNLSLLTNL